MSSDWWAKRLGGGGGGVQPRSSTPPTRLPPPRLQQPVQEPTWAGAGGAGTTTQQMEQHAPMAKEDVASRALSGEWQGGEGMAELKRIGMCPGCGSPNFFSREQGEGGMIRRGPPPAPMCFECGYPLRQTGSEFR